MPIKWKAKSKGGPEVVAEEKAPIEKQEEAFAGDDDYFGAEPGESVGAKTNEAEETVQATPESTDAYNPNEEPVQGGGEPGTTKPEEGKAEVLIGGKPVTEGQSMTMEYPAAKVQIKHPDGTVEETDIQMKSPSGYVGPVARVRANMGATINIGNMEFVRVDCSIEMPCYPQEVDTVWDFVKEWADDRLSSVVEEVRNDSEQG